MPEPFELHAQLAADCRVIGDLPLCRLLLMDDANYPWCVLVPRRTGIAEVHELAEADRILLLGEITRLSAAMKTLFGADKMNVAALGNVVPQLHVHVIARHLRDAAWPRPVWGAAPRCAYSPAERDGTIDRLQAALALPRPRS